jgi:hypothetical protein
MSGGTNTQTQTLPNWLQPYLTTELASASDITPGLSSTSASSLVAPMNSGEQQGLASMQNAAGTGQADANSAAAANQFETSGALLNPASNPYLQNTYNLAAGSVQNSIDSQFAGAGSNVINSLPVQQNQLNNLATQLYGGQYDTGLQTMTQAAAQSPMIQSGLYTPGQETYQAGSTEQQQAQNVISAPYNALSWYSGLLGLNGSSLGGSSTSNNGAAATQDAGLGLAAAGTAAEIAAMY